MRTTLALVGLLTAAPSHAASITSYVAADHKVVIELSGEILLDDDAQLKAILARYPGVEIAGLRLSSPGGNVAGSLKLLELVREYHLTTVVMPGKLCASACFYVFAAGTEKYVGAGAVLAVHSTANIETGQEDLEGTLRIVRMMQAILNLPPAIVGKTVLTPNSSGTALTAEDLRAMGVNVSGGVAGRGDGTAPSGGVPTIGHGYAAPVPAIKRYPTATVGPTTLGGLPIKNGPSPFHQQLAFAPTNAVVEIDQSTCRMWSLARWCAVRYRGVVGWVNTLFLH